MVVQGTGRGLVWMLAAGHAQAAEKGEDHRVTNPLAPLEPHFPRRAKNVIYLFMAGGPSHLELYDYKPKLQELTGKVIPPSYVEGKRFAFIKKDAKLLGTQPKFHRYGDSGLQMSELLPGIGSVADEICLIRSMMTEVLITALRSFI